VILPGLFVVLHGSTKYIYIKSTTVYVTSSELGLAVPLPPEPGEGGGRAHSPAGKGLGESQFRRLGKKLSTLPTLCTGVFEAAVIVFGCFFESLYMKHKNLI
jgi:hypothetical protein